MFTNGALSDAGTKIKIRQSSSEENKRRSSIIIKDKGLGRKIKGKLEKDKLKEYRSYLS